ncbi:M36 family metallopeptidase [Candidatus Ulvibacter alkanivorans]|uniref:M36 family metallopeptidase n=1 Tax=Candidatus Ulvibacter alkanivorans TaxID=2267620 RepID=UPI000DF47F41|nr:M36 family metallopeptidase [Candidatus Ulvibacter alkanivorans]
MKKVTKRLLLLLICLATSHTFAQDVSKNLNYEFEQLLEQSVLQPQDISWEITNDYVSRTSGIRHVYYRQVVNGIQINGTESGIHILPDGTTISAENRFIKNTQNRSAGNANPALTAVQAVQAAASQLNYTVRGTFSVLERNKGASQETLISDGGISLSNIPAKLMYQLNENGELVLTWDISIEETSRQNWWSLRVDASTGNIIDTANWMVSCSFEHDHSMHENVLDYNANLYDMPNYDKATANAAGCNECYEVFAIPLESPYYGPRTIEVSPHNLTASPFGWHDTDGVPGAETTLTQGNNVTAFDANSGFQPDGGANLDFTGYPFDQVYTNTNQYEEASITNLFYLNNTIHDVVYLYGLDEASGNFQQNNYGNGGAGGDRVNANAQIGQNCNATFGTPPDGSSPSMNMFICNGKDGDFDNLVVFHEYAHGISNRLTGGPNNTSCLQNTEQMGEGWSDFYGVILTIEPGDMGTDSRGVGTYLFGQGANGPGIRPFPYSTDLGVNPQTYDDIKTAAVPHGVGSVWATMLWEMTWELIDEYGFDADIFNFTGDVNQDKGNVMALALVTEAMKLQPCSPGFVDGRDAIFAADVALYGGANECLIWDAFAKRGLGVSADQGSSNSRSDGTEAFDTPSGLAMFTAPNDVCLNEGVLTGLGGGTPFGGVYSGPGVTDDGNGNTYTFDPMAAGVGVHTITYDVPSGACSTASSDSDDIEVLSIPPGPTTTSEFDVCPGDSVTLTATLNDPANVIRWFDAETGGSFLFEGTSYTFNPTATTTVYAQESAPGPLSQLVISEITTQTPDTFEIQNVGIETDYTGYTVAVSDEPYTDVNSINTITQPLGVMGADSAIFWNDTSGPNDWGNNIFWNNTGTGWIIIIDDAGNVVDSVFWGFNATEISGFNVTINGFNITAADLDWTGDGADFSTACDNSFRRHDDTNAAADWAAGCESSDYGVANDDIDLGPDGCPGERTAATAEIEDIDPTVTCPADIIEVIDEGDVFTIPDYTNDATATDNCTLNPTLTQDIAPGTEVGEGVYPIEITATDEAGNVSVCTFTLTVDEILGVGDTEFYNNVVLYPNPTAGRLTLVNNSAFDLESVVITDVNGRVIKTVDLKNAGTTSEIEMEAFATGLYFVKINASNTSIVKRVIKK